MAKNKTIETPNNLADLLTTVKAAKKTKRLFGNN